MAPPRTKVRHRVLNRFTSWAKALRERFEARARKRSPAPAHPPVVSPAPASRSVAPPLTPPAPLPAPARPRHPLIDGVDLELAAETAHLCAAAYDDLATFAEPLTARGYLDLALLEAGETQVLVATVPGHGVILAFRGTEPDKLTDLLSDAHATFAAGPFPGTRVHLGFLNAIDLIAAALDVELARRLAESGGLRVILTGHSLGAALATLYFAKHLERGAAHRLTLTTFGSPRVGDTTFVRELTERGAARGEDVRILRVVNDGDIVTRVAPRALGFDHVGSVCFLGPAGEVSFDGGGAESWSRFLATARHSKVNFEDHSILHYVSKLGGGEGADAPPSR